MTKPINLKDLPDDLARFVEGQVAAGRFSNVDDVLRAGKTALEHQQRQEDKLAALRTALAEGDASPDSESGVFDRIRAKHGLPASH